MKKIILIILGIIASSLFANGQNINIYQNGPEYTINRNLNDKSFLWEYRCLQAGGRGCAAYGTSITQCGIAPVTTTEAIPTSRSYKYPYYVILNFGLSASGSGAVQELYYPKINDIKQNYPYKASSLNLGDINIKVASSRTTYSAGSVPNACGLNFTGTSYSFEEISKSYTASVVPFEWILATNICLNAPAIDLRNFISANQGLTGAVFSGPGVTGGNTFSPSLAGVGTWTLVATKTYDNGVATKTFQITVDDFNRESYFDLSTITFCSDAQDINLDTITNGHPNGVWSGDRFLIGSSVNVTSASSGSSTSINKTYTYAWTNAKGCTNSQDFTFTIAPSFAITPIPITAISVCDNSGVVLSTGVSPTGGVWTSSDPLAQSKISNSYINASGLKSGNSGLEAKYPLTYTVNKQGCIKSSSTTLLVRRSEEITTNYPKNTGGYSDVRSTTCNDLTNYNIMSGVSPKKGTWTWITPSSGIKSVLSNDSIINTFRLDSVYTKTKAAANCGPQPCEFIGTYTVTNGNNCPSEVTTIFYVNKRPAPPVTTGASACVVTTGSQSFTLTASSSSVANYNLYWYSKIDTTTSNIPLFSGDKNQLSFNTPTIGKTTTYFARNKDLAIGCFSAYAPTMATVNTIPTVNAGVDQKICQNVSSLQLNGASATIGSSPASGSGAWGGLTNVSANGVFTNSFLPLGDYIVNYTYTTNEKCAASAVKTITVVDYPRVVVGQDNFVCGNIGIHKLNGRGESPTGGTWTITNTKFAKFLKQDSLLIDSLNPLSTNNLKYTFTNSDNCTNTAIRNVTLYEVPTKPQLVGGKVCGEGSVTLSAINAKTSENYLWYDSLETTLSFNQTANFTTPSLIQSRYYFVSKKNLSGCEGKKDSVLAKLVALTPVTTNAGKEIQICKSSANTNMSQFVNQKKGKFSFSNISMLNDTVLSTSTASIGLYPFSYSFVNIDGCTTKVDNIVRLSLNPSLVLQNDTLICKNTKSFVLRTNISGGKWSGSSGVDSSGNFDPSKLSTIGNYTINYIYNKFGCNVSGSTKINLVDRPLSAVLTGSDSGCENDTLTFIASSNESGIHFNFFKNNDTIPFSNNITTKIKNFNLNKISVDAVNSYGCPSLVRVYKDVKNYKIAGQILATPLIINKGQYTSLESSILIDPLDQVSSYEWNFGDSTNKSLFEKSYHYYYDTGYSKITLKVLTMKGCKLTISNNRLVKVLPLQRNVMTDANGNTGDFYTGNDNYIQIFPNPSADGIFELYAYLDENATDIVVQDMNGHVIYEQHLSSLHSLRLDLSSIIKNAGTYVLKMKSKVTGKQRTYKLVKI